MTYGIEGNLNIVNLNGGTFTIDKEPAGTIFYVNASSQLTTINLPPVSSIPVGRHYIIKRNGGAYNVTMDPNSNETIDGSSTKSAGGTWDSWRIVSTGSEWITTDYGAT